MIVHDTGWCYNAITSIPRRGINDYARRITFDRPLSGPELRFLIGWLDEDPAKPGWTPVYVRIDPPWTVAGAPPPAETTYLATTTMDSSD